MQLKAIEPANQPTNQPTNLEWLGLVEHVCEEANGTKDHGHETQGTNDRKAGGVGGSGWVSFPQLNRQLTAPPPPSPTHFGTASHGTRPTPNVQAGDADGDAHVKLPGLVPGGVGVDRTDWRRLDLLQLLKAAKSLPAQCERVWGRGELRLRLNRHRKKR